MLTLTNPEKAAHFFEEKLEFTTGPIELHGMIQRHENINIVDVREFEDYSKGHIPGAINLPKTSWKTYSGLSENKVNVIYCYSEACHLSANAAMEFAKHGFSVMELEGGFETWRQNALPIVG